MTSALIIPQRKRGDIKLVAEFLGMNPNAVSASLKRGKGPRYNEIIEALRAIDNGRAKVLEKVATVRDVLQSNVDDLSKLENLIRKIVREEISVAFSSMFANLN